VSLIPTLLCSSVLVAPATVWGGDIPGSYDPRAAHAATDKNRDGEINRDEFEQRMIQFFYFADVDKDGYVTIGQLMVFDEAQLFESADLDNDSRLSLSEFLVARSKNFSATDTDRSGGLSVDEVVVEFNE